MQIIGFIPTKIRSNIPVTIVTTSMIDCSVGIRFNKIIDNEGQSVETSNVFQFPENNGHRIPKNKLAIVPTTLQIMLKKLIIPGKITETPFENVPNITKNDTIRSKKALIKEFPPSPEALTI